MLLLEINHGLNFDKLLIEVGYSGNIGAMEMVQFFKVAEPEDIQKLKTMIDMDRVKEAWNLIQHITGSRLETRGREFGL